MTRVLQLRRGTTANNDNFTGLPGEITMDIDAKTLRIHDGETLGGFEIARKDDIQNSNFDINNVSDEFWENLFNRFAPKTLTKIETVSVPVNSQVSYLNIAVNTNKMPTIVNTVLICQNAEAGYNVGDEVMAFGIGNRCNPIPNIIIENDELNLYLMIGAENYWVSHKQNGTPIKITDENWRILFRVYC